MSIEPCEPWDDLRNPACQRCKCCELEWVNCEQCEDGLGAYYCGEDCCICVPPEDNVKCLYCDGKAGWYRCSCDDNGKHAKSEA